MIWLDILSLCISFLVPFGLFVGRNWLTAKITEGVRHGFNAQLERMKSDLRNTEESFRSQLRDRESEIATLRETVFTGRQGRQQLLDKRKIEAVERLWSALHDFAPYLHLASMVAVFKLDEFTKLSQRDKPKVQQTFQMLLGSTPDPKPKSPPPEAEQPFVTPLAWALFAAYRTTVMHAYALVKMFSVGVTDLSLFNQSKVPELMKAALPHYGSYIDQWGLSGCMMLLDQLSDSLLAECKHILEGAEEDKASAERAVAISKMVGEMHKAEAAAEVPAEFKA